jgi:hypothetical protein
MSFVFKCIDGEATLSERDYERWKYVFSDLDLDHVLKSISESSYSRPWMRGKGWFYQLSGYLAKLEKKGPKGDRQMADIIITNEQFKSGFILEEYNGVYSLVNAYRKRDGETEMKWAYIEKREKNEATDKWEGKPGKKIPWKIELGTRDEAIANLRRVLAELGAEPDGPERLSESSDGNRESSDPEYDDIPW